MTSSKILSLIVGSLLTGVAQAQLVVANDRTCTAAIWHIDVTTGAATALYSGVGAEATAWGMAYDASTHQRPENDAFAFRDPSAGKATNQSDAVEMTNVP